MLDIDWESIRNPILDQEPEISLRDPCNLLFMTETFISFIR